MKLSGDIWILSFFICILLACQQETGNWTAVNRTDAYIYGVWKAPTSKSAENAIADVLVSIQTHSNSQTPIEIASEKVVHEDFKNTYKHLPYLTTDPPENLLPQDGEANNWVRSREITTYNPDTLYIDRSVDKDIFINYGFERQAEVEYQNSKFGSVPYILLEVFDMGTPENAFGIFSVHSYPQPKYEWVGCKAIVSGKYLRFWKGKYFIQIEGYAIATGIQKGMIALAQNTAKRIQDPPQKIPLIDILPTQYIRSSEKLFYSNWTLRKVYKTVPDVIPQLEDETIGILAQHNTYSHNPEKPSVVFVVRFPNVESAENAFTQYLNDLKNAKMSLKIERHNGAILVDEIFAKKRKE